MNLSCFAYYSNDFFSNLIDNDVEWTKDAATGGYVGKTRGTQDVKWTASGVDLLFGSNSELRAMSEYYACDDGKEAFKADFVKAWDKVMNNGLYVAASVKRSEVCIFATRLRFALLTSRSGVL